LQQWRRLRSAPVLSAGEKRPRLTPRELEILIKMTDGLATKAIARSLGVAVKTVENHKIRIFDKLGVRTQAHAVAMAIGHGLVPGQREHSSAADDTAAALTLRL
jgi:DNA-binding NarL/FixJ family response regulator